MLNVDIITLTGPDVLSRISLGQGPERKGEKEEKRMNFMNVDITLNSQSRYLIKPCLM